MKLVRNGFILIPLIPEIDVTHVVTIHYFEYPKTFEFQGESHNFWEFLYVDKGEVSVTAGNIKYKLKQGQLIIHPPNEFHTVECNRLLAPNLVVVSFVCDSKAMDYFISHKIIYCDNQCKQYFDSIITEGKNSFSTDLGDPWYKELVLKEDRPFATLHQIKASIEQLLIHLIRIGDKKVSLSTTIRTKENQIKVQNTIEYLNQNIDKNLTLEQICHYSGMGRSLLLKLFREETGWSVIEYYCRMKIEKAKLMIRNGEGNFSIISQKLGYNSIHYFSRQFHKITGMSPREYGKSIIDLS